MSSRIVFIDSLVTDYQSLIPQISSASEIVVLDADKDGVMQILAALRSRFELSAIDIISHGAPGTLMLGSGELNNANLAGYAEQLTEIGTHLSDSGDILLYGCEVAQGNVGQQFIERLAHLTGANVAASTNLTGAQDLGGDWVLGTQIGTIESRTLQLSYGGVLEFRVSPITNIFQTNPSITALAAGGFVVSWQSYDGSGDSIYAQRYDASGVAQGVEFQVNTHTLLSQSKSSIAALTDGGFVVSWQSKDQDSSDWGIYAQRYKADGAVQGDEFQVNITTGGPQEEPSITALADGGFVVSWTSQNQDGSGKGIYARRYDDKGVAQGGEFPVNTTTTADQYNPSITALADGGFVVSWESPDGNGDGIYARRYDANGVAQNIEFQVNTTTTSGQYDPSITALADGGFVVSWQSNDDIYAQRYKADGAAQGGEFQVNTTTSGYQEDPSITTLNDGGFVVSWQSDGQDGSSYGIYAQRYDANGVAQGGEFRVNTYTLGDQSAPSITALADGGFVVSWQSFGQNGSSYGIYAQRYDADGNPVTTPPVAIDDTLTTDEDQAFTLNVVANDTDPDGDVLNVSDVTQGGHGAVTFADGSITYTPAANYNGTDSFTYTVSDGKGGTGIATVNVTVNPVNDLPTGATTGALTDGTEDVVYSVSTAALLQGFTDVDNGTLSVINLISANGTLLSTADGWNFTPTQDYNGSVTFTYQVSDGAGGVVNVTRTLNLTPVNDKPVGSPAGVLANSQEDTPYTILQSDLLNGYSDADGDALSVTGLMINHGTLSTFNSSTGSWTFTPDKDFNGTVNLSYGITDGKGGNVSDIDHSFVVDPVNDTPIAGDDQVTILEDASVTFGFDAFLSNDLDADGSGQTIVGLDTTGTKSSVSIDANNRTITVSADADVFDLLATGNTAMDSFKYILRGSTGETTTATVQISVRGVNDGNPNLLGTVKADILNGTPGEDRIKGNNGNDILNGGEGADDLFGENGDDTLNGGNSIDNLFGGNGNDLLNGGNGNDWLGGEKGNDTLIGGLGSDVFLFAKSGGNDIITDFANGFDKIQIAADTGKTSLSQLTITGGTGANGIVYTTVNLGNGGQATLIGVPTTDVDATDFIFPV